jgi:tRNA-binding protein
MSEEPLQLHSMSPYEAFQMVEMRVGRITRVETNARARKPSYKLWIDFGPEMGTKTSSAQIVANYAPEHLLSRLVVCATNLGVRNIAGFQSEVLTMGMDDAQGNVVLLQPASEVPLGSRVY